MDEMTVADRGLDFEQFVSQSELRSAYQPIVDLASGEIVAFEALARSSASGRSRWSAATTRAP